MADDHLARGADFIATNKSGTDHIQQYNLVNPTRGQFPWSLTPSAPSGVTLGTATGIVKAANANRKGLIIVNMSANWVFLAFNTSALADMGIALAPNGGSYNMSIYDFCTHVVNGIASGAGSKVTVQEYT